MKQILKKEANWQLELDVSLALHYVPRAAVTNDHKLGSKHKFFLSPFWKLEIQYQGLAGHNSKVQK